MKKRTPRLYIKDLSNKQFGRLTVISYAETKKGKVFWHCLCECGNTCTIRADHLKSGNTTSCGCLNPQLMKKNPRHVTHGKSHTVEAAIYMAIKQRCYNPNNPSYKNYGARGIGLCNRWLQSQVAFFEDMGVRPSPDHTIERLNNDGPYSPDNCVWMLRKFQARNQRKTVRLTIHGKTASLPEWAETVGIPPYTIKCRLRRGWDTKRALFTPVDPRYQHDTHPKRP